MNANRSLPDNSGFTLITVLYRSTSSARRELDGWAALVSTMSTDVEWILIDNSEDGSDADYFDRYSNISNIRVERRPENPGFAHSSNLGARLARHRWLVFLNPDITPDSAKFSSVMRQVRTNSDAVSTFAVGQTTSGFMHQGVHLIQNVWFSDRGRNARRAPIGPSGGFGIFDSDLFEDFGGFAEGLFAWGEDAELAIRLSNTNVPCVGIDEFFDHAGGHSFKTDPALRKRKVWLLARNRQSIAWLHFSPIRLVHFQLFVLCISLIKIPVHLRNKTLGSLVRGNLAGFGRARAETILQPIPSLRKHS